MSKALYNSLCVTDLCLRASRNKGKKFSQETSISIEASPCLGRGIFFGENRVICEVKGRIIPVYSLTLF